MATQTKSVSGSTTTYLITDVAGNTMSVAVTTGPQVTGNLVLITQTVAVHLDAIIMLATLTQELQGGLLP